MKNCTLNTCLYLFQNNLRLQDNPSLYYAYFNFWKVVPVLIVPEDANTYLNGIGQEMGKFRKQFLLEAAFQLKTAFAEQGIDLILIRNNSNLLLQLQEICQTYQIGYTVTSYPRGTYEGDILEHLYQTTAIFTCEDDNLVSISDLPFTQLPTEFTLFQKKMEEKLTVRKTTQLPRFTPFQNSHNLGDTFEIKSQTKHLNSAYPFSGGEQEAHKRLKYYLWESQRISTYKQTRNELIGQDYSSKLSAYLSLGNISPVQVYYAIKEFEEQVEKNESTYWLFFELLWREYFILVAEQSLKRIYSIKGIKDKAIESYTNDIIKFEQWCTGNTEQPFINANMKELIATGYMSNRGRQNVASYLVHHLKVDWRWGATFFEKHLIDYDISLNWCNWMYIAGVGNTIKNNVFNPNLQQERYDPSGTYCKLWNK